LIAETEADYSQGLLHTDTRCSKRDAIKVSNLLQFQQSIISSMKRIPWMKEMGEKTLNIFIEDITYMFYCLSMICTFCI
jgi:hypothetical protein